MNIFFVHQNPTLAAQCLVDKHVLKMILESTQLLANAYYMEKANKPPPKTLMGAEYQKTHWDHPCAVWVRQDFKHWHWVKMHAFELLKQYKVRFPKALLEEHACAQALRYMENNAPTDWLRPKQWRDPPQCMPDEFKVHGDTVAAYRAYYKIGKKHLHSWTNANPPEWIAPMSKPLRERAQDLIDGAELAIVNPHDHRPDGIADSDWDQIVFMATEIINGRMD